MMTNCCVLTNKIDIAILKLSFQFYVILSSALRTHFEIFGRQFVYQSSNNTSDLDGFFQHIQLIMRKIMMGDMAKMKE